MPRGELDRVDTKILDIYYKPTKLLENGDIVDDNDSQTDGTV